MAVASLIIATLALILATASLAVQITLGVLKYRETSNAPKIEDEFLRQPTAKEIESFFAPTSVPDKDKINEIMENPDSSNYSGINEEFNV